MRLKELAVTVETEVDPQDIATVKWCEVEYPVRNERLQAAVLEAHSMEEKFKQQQDLDSYDKVVAAYNVLIGLVKQALSAGTLYFLIERSYYRLSLARMWLLEHMICMLKYTEGEDCKVVGCVVKRWWSQCSWSCIRS